jgi:adenylate kinase
LGKLQEQERELLEVQSLPFRKYLMDHVMPTLTKGLIEVATVRPEDPIDYLSEYLFKNANVTTNTAAKK